MMVQRTRRKVLKLAVLIGTGLALAGAGVSAVVAQGRPEKPPGRVRRGQPNRAVAVSLLMNEAPPRPPVGPGGRPLQPGHQGGRP
jgi:hypothetical protein